MFFDENGKLVNENQIRGSIICWGASTRNGKMIKHLPVDSKVEFIIDKNVRLHGEKMDGYNIFGVEKLRGYGECTVLSVLVRFKESIIKSVHEVNPKCRVCFFAEELFDNKLLVESNQKIMQKSNSFQYVHIFPGDSIFITIFYEMIEESFEIEGHLFLLILKKEFGIPELLPFAEKSNLKHGNIIFIDDAHGYDSFFKDDGLNCNMLFENESFYRILESSYRIFLHSAFYSDYIVGMLRKFSSNLFNKMTWVCWGDDIFCYNPESVIVSEVLRRVERAVALKLRLAEIKKNYGIVGQPIKRGIYTYLPKGVVFEDKGSYLHDTVNIMVGHGPVESDCSEYALEILGRFSGDNIRIICPLSTGGISMYDNEQKKIIQKGREIFGEKFIPITDFMGLSEYYNFLAFNIDILVNAMTVLQSVTALTFASCLGKKVFLRRDLADTLKENGINSDDIETLREKSYSELLMDKEELRVDLDIREKYNQGLVDEWKKLFA